MSDTIKNKKFAARYIPALLLGIAGLITMILSHTISSANALDAFGKMVAFVVLGIVLNAAAAAAPQAVNGLVGLVGSIGAIACYTLALGNALSSRILLISALFTWDSNNKVGWSVFYMTVACVVCFFLAVVILIIASFMRDVKVKKEA